MAVFDQGGGGGKAGADASDLSIILAKPYELNGLSQETLDQINQMFEELYRALRQTTQIDSQRLIGRYNTGNGNQQQVSLGSGLTLSTAGVLNTASSGSVIPTLVNQFWYGWIANFDVSSGTATQAVNTVIPIIEKSTGAHALEWTQTFSTLPYLNLVLSAAQTVAYSQGIVPATTVNGGTLRTHDPTADFFMATGTPTGGAGQKYWIGVFNTKTTPTLSSDTAPATNFAAFRFSTAASDTKWQYVTRDGAATTVTDSGVTVTADTEYHLKVRISGSTVYFSINGGSETAVTANIPGATEVLYPQLQVWKDVTGANQLVNMYFNRMVFRVGTPLSRT